MRPRWLSGFYCLWASAKAENKAVFHGAAVVCQLVSSVTYLGQFFIILRHQLGFDCEMNSDEYAEAEFFPFRSLNAFTCAANLHAVKVYFAHALLPH